MDPEFGDQIVTIFETSDMSNERLRKMQDGDNTIKELMKHLRDNTKPDFGDAELKRFRPVFKKLVIEDGILVKKRDSCVVPVIPEGEIHKVLRSVHGAPLASHYGISKSYFKLVGKFYFPNMVPRLAEYINSCPYCIKRKMPKNTPRPVIQPIEVDHGDIGGVISYDFKGPLPTAEKSILYQHRSRFVLVIIDHATRYVMAHPTPTMEAKVVAEIMISRWIPNFGVPRTVISDRAKSFTGTVMRTVYGALEVDMQLTAAYNPACNGLCEQVNRNISSLLFIMVEEGGDDWAKKINLLFSAYNASVQSSTGYSPNFLVYGRELIEPIDLHLNRQCPKDAKGRQVLEELEERLRLRRRALDLLQIRQEETNAKRAERSKGTANAPKFEIGELVGFRGPPSSTKLNKYYETDHRVIKKVSDDTYVIINDKTGYERIINVRKLRKINVNLKWNDIAKFQKLTPCVQSSFSDEDDDDRGDEEPDPNGKTGEQSNRDLTTNSAGGGIDGFRDGHGDGELDDDNEYGDRDDKPLTNDISGSVGGDDFNDRNYVAKSNEGWNSRLRDRKKLKKPIRL